MTARIRVALADDHPIVLDGLETILSLAGDIEVCARSVNGDEALEAVRTQRPDVLVLDLVMPRLDGLGVLRELAKEPHPPRVVVLSAVLREADIVEALRLGALGIVPKELAAPQIVECIRTVHRGEKWIESGVSARALAALVQERASGSQAPDELTPREKEMVKLVAAGLRNKEIGARLDIAEGTVKIHLHNIFKKIGVQSRVELALYARSRGWLG